MIKRLVLAALLFAWPVLVPSTSLEKPLYLLQLSIAPAPATLAVPVDELHR